MDSTEERLFLQGSDSTRLMLLNLITSATRIMLLWRVGLWGERVSLCFFASRGSKAMAGGRYCQDG